VVDLAAALMLLTRIPVPWERFSATAPDHTRSAWAYPVVGVVVGAVGALGLGLSAWSGLSALAASLVAVTAQAFATGAFHEDGLADVADGFGGGRERARKLEIMRDSRIGTYGTLALVFSVGLRAAALAALPFGTAACALVAGGAISRASIVAVLFRSEPARPDGLGAGTGRPSSATFAAALALGLLVVLVALPAPVALLATAVGLLAVAAVSAVARRQIGGYTGDVLGAGQQVCECAFLLAVSAASP
jgi:adenosylcobinamide-GDP ribazoletransferase